MMSFNEYVKESHTHNIIAIDETDFSFIIEAKGETASGLRGVTDSATKGRSKVLKYKFKRMHPGGVLEFNCTSGTNQDGRYHHKQYVKRDRLQ